MTTRRTMWKRLGNEDLDVLVLGGGITGAGIARDAALRGLRVALVEMRDLAYGTSSRSTKLVHGGLRYLEMGELSLVFESVNERGVLADMAPHLVRPLGFVLPVFENAERSLAIVDTGLWIYDALSLFRSPKLHRRLPKAKLAVEQPSLKVDGLEGAALYYDCATDDARLTIETAVDAVEQGAIVSTWTKAVGLLRDEGGIVVGARVRCERTGEERDVRARCVVNATGPWSDKTLALAGRRGPSILRPTKGVHVVFEARKLPLHHAVLVQHPRDARVMFAIPWGDRTYVGTTDTDADFDPSEVRATSDDVDYILEACDAYFPKHPVGRDDVLATWAGLRPLLAPPEKGDDLSESNVSREHHLFVDRDGLVTIAGGKLTTFRLMAMQTVDEVCRRIDGPRISKRDVESRSRSPLPGAADVANRGVRDHLASRIRAASGRTLPTDVVDHLVDVYGARAPAVAGLIARDASLAARIAPDRPEIYAQVAFALDSELAVTLEDVLVRRTQIFFQAKDQGAGSTDAVADFIATRLSLSADERSRQVREFLAEVEKAQRFRHESDDVPTIHA